MKIRRVYHLKLLLRIMIACFFFVCYFLKPDILDFTSKSMNPFLWIFWGILFTDFVLRFIPGEFHPIGMQKHLKRNFFPTLPYLQRGALSQKDLDEQKKMNRGALRVFIFYLALNLIWYSLYYTHLFRPREMFMIMIFYYVGDIVCATLFCPFRIFITGYRCCNVCRIYNWDAIMLVMPVMLIPSFFSFSLSLVAICYTFCWEYSYHQHPEYFLETCNERISCIHCNHEMCPHKKYARWRRKWKKLVHKK